MIKIKTLKAKRIERERIAVEALMELSRRDKWRQLAKFMLRVKKNNLSLLGLVFFAFTVVGFLTILIWILGLFIKPIGVR